MGYRTYIGVIPKRQYNKIKGLTVDELYTYFEKNRYDEDGDYDDYISVRDFGTELYEFGKYTDFEPPKGSVKRFFTKKETQKDFEGDNEINIVTKEFFAYIIMTYAEKVRKYYSDMNNVFFDEKGWPKSELIKTMKVEYNYPNNKTRFDFSKATEEEQDALPKIFEHIRSMGQEWGVTSFFKDSLPFDLGEDRSATVSHSWKYEYAIFELVYLYKTFDWKRNHLYYYGC